jgi:branched-chain amino acid transport system permease protein
VIGVNVAATKGKVFFLSSVYAGVSGVLYALSIGSIAPQSFGLELSLQFLAIIVIGGMGSVAGAIIGSAFVMSLPLLLQLWASDLPIFSLSFSASHLSQYIYGAAVILVLIFKPSGIVGIWESLRNSVSGRKRLVSED